MHNVANIKFLRNIHIHVSSSDISIFNNNQLNNYYTILNIINSKKIYFYNSVLQDEYNYLCNQYKFNNNMIETRSTASSLKGDIVPLETFYYNIYYNYLKTLYLMLNELQNINN